MPLQAGNDNLLKRMKRLYTVESYAKIVDELREKMPNVGLTTDIIVGFPGETEEEFEGTLACMERFQFDGAYMFRYSPRPGTPAAEMEQVPTQIGKERLNKLIAVQREISIAKNEACVGNTYEVLVDGPSAKNPGMLQGYSRCFRLIQFPGDPEKYRGDIVNVKTTQPHLWGLSGKIQH